MSNGLTTLKGVCPAVFTLYEDESCVTLDHKSYRRHVKRLVDNGVSALVVGGHASEIVALSDEERALQIGIAREEANGQVPIVGGVVGDSTAEAIRQGREAAEAGADAVLFTPPAIPGWRPEAGADFLIRHYQAFEDAVGLPIVLFAAPSDRYGQQYHLNPSNLVDLAREVESVVACKITSQWDIAGFTRCARALKSVRDIGCLKAGGSAQFATYAYGADGSLSGGTNFSVEDDVSVLKLTQEGRLGEAKDISDSWNLVYDAIYGTQVGRPVAYFHYRYKIAAWLLGEIDIPHMRLPQLPPPLEDIRGIHQALELAGKVVVREPQELSVSTV